MLLVSEARWGGASVCQGVSHESHEPTRLTTSPCGQEGEGAIPPVPGHNQGCQRQGQIAAEWKEGRQKWALEPGDLQETSLSSEVQKALQGGEGNPPN